MKTLAPSQPKRSPVLQQKLIADICRLFIGKNETDAMITRSLQMIGEHLGLCRVMLLNYQQQAFSCRYEWYENAHLMTSNIGLTKLLEDKEARITEALIKRDIFYKYIDDTNRLDISARYGLDYNDRLFFPVFCEDNFWGLLDFVQYPHHMGWTENDIGLGETLAALFSGIISRQSREYYLLSALSEAKEMADQASRAKLDFLSRMNHEMRTPMNAIIGMTDIALGTKETEKKNYCLNNIYEASKHLLGVIKDILDMSKLETSQLKLSMDEFDFEQMLMNVVDVLNSLALDKQQDLVINIDTDVPRSLIGDELRISQVITNLLSNAIKFTPNGGMIKMHVSLLAVKGDVHTLQVQVIDNGIGISKTYLNRIFNSFDQADSGFARQYGGTGLGLAICKHIVNMMGGDIKVDSVINEGSVFTFTMKLQKSSYQIEHTLTGNISRSEINVLVIDDSLDIREYFLAVMSAVKVPCEVAKSGQQALAMIEKRVEKPFKIFIVDWQMPEMNGIELAKKIRAMVGDTAPIIMISGTPWRQIEQEAVAAGVNLFIPKPLFPSVIINTINECLGITEKDKSDAEKAIQAARPMASQANDFDISVAYNGFLQEEDAKNYDMFLPMIDVFGGFSRVMNNKALYFTLLRNFSIRGLANEMIEYMQKKEYKAMAQKAHTMWGMAANLGLSGLMAVLDEITEHAKIEISPLPLIGKLDETVTQTVGSIEQLLEMEGIK
ncbi:MAG: ATP-binding protein [Firmicutes bacterium]|nr:ATP-binding protein [Bacillota bacterium]